MHQRDDVEAEIQIRFLSGRRMEARYQGARQPTPEEFLMLVTWLEGQFMNEVGLSGEKTLQ